MLVLSPGSLWPESARMALLPGRKPGLNAFLLLFFYFVVEVVVFVGLF